MSSYRNTSRELAADAQTTPKETVTSPTGPSMSRPRQVGIALRLLFAVVAIFFSLFPVVWIISASINPSSNLATRDREGYRVTLTVGYAL